MRSYTSSSKEAPQPVLSHLGNPDSACPEGPWLKTWLLTIAVAIALLAGWETTLRRMGYRPTVIDDEALWASHRSRVYTQCCEKAIVLLGDCRVQLGLVPRTLRAMFPKSRVVQLAVQETSPLAALRDLAADERFHGIVVCGLNARLLCKDMWGTQQSYVEYYHTRFGLNTRLNRLVSTTLQQTIAAIDPQLRLDDLAIRLATGQPLPAPYYLETHADRSRLADYDRVDLQMHRKWAFDRTRWLSNNQELPGVEEWLHDALEVEEWVEAIQARGGRVVFVQLPTTGQTFTYDEFIFPKEMYWDAFAARTSALCIHFKDVPRLAGFDCPDTSHLDRADAPRFTSELAQVLQDRGLFAAPHCAVASTQVPGRSAKCPCRGGHGHRSGSAKCPCCEANSPHQDGHHAIASHTS